jgi:phosphatidylserine/phosphatidylglycerophosphate/cardiolipin synthase-like enzyme
VLLEGSRDIGECIGRPHDDERSNRENDYQREIRAPRLETPKQQSDSGAAADPSGKPSGARSDAPHERRKERVCRPPEREKHGAEAHQRDHDRQPLGLYGENPQRGEANSFNIRARLSWKRNPCSFGSMIPARSRKIRSATRPVRYSFRVNFVENLVDGNRLLPVLLQDLHSATRSIHIAIFLFFDDPIGEEISGVLEAKARAGIAVRVLLNVEKTDMGDPFGTGEKEMMKEDPSFARDPTDVSKMRQRLSDAGVAVVDTELNYDRIVETGEPELDTLAREIRRTIKVSALHVDHRKIVTIDGRIAYCGSANFGAQYQYRVPFDPAKDARDEASAARQAGQPEPWWKWHDRMRLGQGLPRALAPWRRSGLSIPRCRDPSSAARHACFLGADDQERAELADQ